MRLPLTAILLLAITPVFALPNPVGTRTLRDLPSFPIETLDSSLSNTCRLVKTGQSRGSRNGHMSTLTI